MYYSDFFVKINLINPEIREQGAENGKDFWKIYATTSSIASSVKEAEKRCAATHHFANLETSNKVKG